MTTNPILWSPSKKLIDEANITGFISFVNTNFDQSLNSYDALFRWSIDEKEDFWSALWDFCEVVGDKGDRVLIDGENIETAQWFPDARLNFAENLLRKRNTEIAICFRAENQVDYKLTYRELYQQVASVADWLK
ncbi:MAG: acetoacetate--CoA ligase, partial [Gammaproteobacteria bacterium]|nr:acetoacetate--CoA ligase [Gammaproteobacteria bacterium]